VYIDYRVLALFTSERDAKNHLATVKVNPRREYGDGDRIEEFLLYPDGNEPKRVTTYEHIVTVWDLGVVTGELERSRTEWEYDTIYSRPKLRPEVRFVRAPMHENKGGRLEVRGSNRKAVDQAYSDALARLKVSIDQTGRAKL
jgi:hypothetical protein